MPSDLPGQHDKAAARSSASTRRRVVIVHQGALGDFLLVLPVLEAIARRHPATSIDFCAKAELVALIADRPYVGQVYPSDSAALTPFFHEDSWRHAAIPHFFDTADQVLIFGQLGSRLLAERLEVRLRHPVHWIQSFPGTGQVRPVPEFLCEQMREAGWDIELAPPRITIAAADLAAVRHWLAVQVGDADCRPVLLHPGSGGRGKIWPLTRWWSLIGWLRSHCAQPICLSLGPADEHLRSFAREAQNQLGVRLLEPPALPRLAAFLSRCRFYVGNDSGVSHLAAVVGVPAVVIFGPTDPRVWGPVGTHVQIVRSRWQQAETLSWSRDASPPAVEPELRKVLEGLLGA